MEMGGLVFCFLRFVTLCRILVSFLVLLFLNIEHLFKAAVSNFAFFLFTMDKMSSVSVANADKLRDS